MGGCLGLPADWLSLVQANVKYLSWYRFQMYSLFTFLLLVLGLGGFSSAKAGYYDGFGHSGPYRNSVANEACQSAQAPYYTGAAFNGTCVPDVNDATTSCNCSGTRISTGEFVPFFTQVALTWDGIVDPVEPPPPDPCPAKAGQSAIPTGKVGYGESAEGTNPINAVLCDGNSCMIEIQQATAIPIGGGLQGNYISQARYTGVKATGSCPLIVVAPTPKDPTLPKPIDTVTPDANTPDGVPMKQSDCPAGSAFGQVNGVNVCAPPGTKVSYVPDTTTQDNTGTTTQSTTTRTDTVEDDGSIKTTTTTNSTSGGNTTTTTTTTSSNPGTSLGSSTEKGEGITGVDLGPAPSAETGEAPTITGIAPGTGTDGEGGASKSFAVTPHFTGNNTCIADRSVSVLGITITVPLSQLCPWFDVMYKVVSLLAVFAAFRILVMA